VHAFVVRVWVPDRPGALGQVASRIGAVHGDVIGIEILERGAGRAVDELVVGLPDASLVDLLVAEIRQVDGVNVEDVRPLPADRHDPAIASLEIASRLAEAGSAVLDVLTHDISFEMQAEWAVVFRSDCSVLSSVGPAPAVAWLAAFVEGARHLAEAGADGAPSDIAWAPLGSSETAVAVGRHGRPWRWRERRQLTELARLTGALIARSAPVGPAA
jgi:hypothetical protein